MPSLAANLQLTSVPYPVIGEENVSIIITNTSQNFTALRSPQVETAQATLLAFAEAAAFELDIALDALSQLSKAIDVSFFAI
jgi:hypothetical protein